MYSKLNDEQKNWILSLNGKDLYEKANELKDQGKIDNETTVEMFSFWLNENNLRHDDAFVRIHTPAPDKAGRSVFVVKNESIPKLFWEKFDDNLSSQQLKNEREVIWHSARAEKKPTNQYWHK